MLSSLNFIVDGKPKRLDLDLTGGWIDTGTLSKGDTQANSVFMITSDDNINRLRAIAKGRQVSIEAIFKDDSFAPITRIMTQDEQTVLGKSLSIYDTLLDQ